MGDAGAPGVLAPTEVVGSTPGVAVETAVATSFSSPATTAVSSPIHTVKERKLFFMCRFYGFYQRNRVCGADQ